jgi:hypothetical protein
LPLPRQLAQLELKEQLAIGICITCILTTIINMQHTCKYTELTELKELADMKFIPATH